ISRYLAKDPNAEDWFGNEAHKPGSENQYAPRRRGKPLPKQTPPSSAALPYFSNHASDLKLLPAEGDLRVNPERRAHHDRKDAPNFAARRKFLNNLFQFFFSPPGCPSPNEKGRRVFYLSCS